MANLPRLPSLPKLAPPARLAPAVRVPRAELTQKSLQVYPDKPAWFSGPVTEWICWWWLKEVKKFRQNDDWYYQAAAKGLTIFASRDFTRLDFLLPVGGDHPASSTAGARAIAWDPITTWTHRDPALDRLKRTVLLNNKSNPIQLIWIDGATLEAEPFHVLELALRGIDISSRNRGA